MMVFKFACPECKAVLKPGKPIPAGKMVTCPKCGNNFPVKAESQEAIISKAVGEKQAAGKSKPTPSRPAAAAKPQAKKPEPKPTPPKPPPKKPLDDEDDGAPTYAVIKEQEEERAVSYEPDLSVKDPRGPAQGLVIKPSNWLMIQGAAGFLGWMILLIVLLIPMCFPMPEYSGVASSGSGNKTLGIPRGFGVIAQENEPPNLPKTPDSEKPSSLTVAGFDFATLSYFAWYVIALVFAPVILGMAYCAVVIYGAVNMQNLESRVWSIVSCVMVMLPFNAGGLLGLTAVALPLVLGMVFEDDDTINFYLIVFIVIECLIQAGFAAWALRTLMDPKVKAGFEFKPQD